MRMDGWTGTDGDMIKLIVAIRNFANAPTNTLIYFILMFCVSSTFVN
jgi:phage shock protein PspC (stress-responsive transcriptional regulator)